MPQFNNSSWLIFSFSMMFSLMIWVMKFNTTIFIPSFFLWKSKLKEFYFEYLIK